MSDEITKTPELRPAGSGERADVTTASGAAPKRSMAEYLKANSVRAESGCLEWTGPTDRDGYGRGSFDGERVSVHRAAWSLENGPIPDGLHVCHHCDNPPCIDDSHLFLGTAADNAADKVTKGRQSRGDGYPFTKLTEDQARAILKAEGTISDIARQFGMSRPLVSRLRAGLRWSHLQAGTAVEGGPGSSPASIAETGRGIDALSPDCGDPAREIGGPPDVVGPMDAVKPPQQDIITCDVSLRNIRDGLRELAAVGEEIAAKLEAASADPWEAVGPMPSGPMPSGLVRTRGTV